MTYIISFANNKGGIAKSSSVICVADRLYNLGYRVLVMDLDMQCNVTYNYLYKENIDFTIINFLKLSIQKSNHASFDQVVHRVGEKGNAYLDVIGTNEDEMETLDNRLLMDDRDRTTILREELKPIVNKKLYDFILIDTPPQLNHIIYNALNACTHYIMPIEPESFAFNGAVRFLKRIDEVVVQRNNRDLKLLGILFTKYHKDSRTILHKNHYDKFINLMGENIFNTTIRRNIAIPESQTLKQSLYEYSPESNSAQDYSDLTDEILSKLNQE